MGLFRKDPMDKLMGRSRKEAREHRKQQDASFDQMVLNVAEDAAARGAGGVAAGFRATTSPAQQAAHDARMAQVHTVLNASVSVQGEQAIVDFHGDETLEHINRLMSHFYEYVMFLAGEAAPALAEMADEVATTLAQRYSKARQAGRWPQELMLAELPDVLVDPAGGSTFLVRLQTARGGREFGIEVDLPQGDSAATDLPVALLSLVRVALERAEDDEDIREALAIFFAQTQLYHKEGTLPREPSDLGMTVGHVFDHEIGGQKAWMWKVMLQPAPPEVLAKSRAQAEEVLSDVPDYVAAENPYELFESRWGTVDPIVEELYQTLHTQAFMAEDDDPDEAVDELLIASGGDREALKTAFEYALINLVDTDTSSEPVVQAESVARDLLRAAVISPLWLNEQAVAEFAEKKRLREQNRATADAEDFAELEFARRHSIHPFLARAAIALAGDEMSPEVYVARIPQLRDSATSDRRDSHAKTLRGISHCLSSLRPYTPSPYRGLVDDLSHLTQRGSVGEYDQEEIRQKWDEAIRLIDDRDLELPPQTPGMTDATYEAAAAAIFATRAVLESARSLGLAAMAYQSIQDGEQSDLEETLGLLVAVTAGGAASILDLGDRWLTDLALAVIA